MIDSVTAAGKTGAEFLSQHKIHMEVSQHLVEVSQDVANFILESKDDVWEKMPQKSLVEAYLENTKKTLEIFGNVMECVEKADFGQHVILEAVAQFDNESAGMDLGGIKKRYEKTLKELKKLKAMEDAFAGDELTTQLKLIIEQHESLLKEVSEVKKKLDNEVQKAVAEEIAEEHKGIVDKWVHGDKSDAMKKRIDALKKQQEALKKLNDKLESVEKGTEKETQFDEEALKSISELVEGVEEKISDILNDLDNAINNEGDEVDTKLSLHSIKDKVKKIIEKTKELGESVDNHSKLIREGRFHVLEKINSSGKDHHFEDAKHQTEQEYQTGET